MCNFENKPKLGENAACCWNSHSSWIPLWYTLITSSRGGTASLRAVLCADEALRAAPAPLWVEMMPNPWDILTPGAPSPWWDAGRLVPRCWCTFVILQLRRWWFSYRFTFQICPFYCFPTLCVGKIFPYGVKGLFPVLWLSSCCMLAQAVGGSADNLFACAVQSQDWSEHKATQSNSPVCILCYFFSSGDIISPLLSCMEIVS